jgi:hypothetical protein
MAGSPLPLKRPTRKRAKYPYQGFIEYQGVKIDVENRAGSIRRGVADDGTKWATKMLWHYGECRGTVGADGDPVDVFVGPDPFAPYVFVIQAKFPGSRAFDETKSMLGFANQAEAVKAFRAAYDKPGFFKSVVRWPIGAWREAMARPHVHRLTMTQPLKKGGYIPMTVDTRAFAEPLKKAGEQGADNEDVDVVGDKISKLMDEGKPQDQAVAIALDMERRGELAKGRPFMPDVNDPRRNWVHIGGDLEASYDGAVYVDVRVRGNEGERLFLSPAALNNAAELVKGRSRERLLEVAGDTLRALQMPRLIVDLHKAEQHKVKAYERRTKSGKMVMVRQHEQMGRKKADEPAEPKPAAAAEEPAGTPDLKDFDAAYDATAEQARKESGHKEGHPRFAKTHARLMREHMKSGAVADPEAAAKAAAEPTLVKMAHEVMDSGIMGASWHPSDVSEKEIRAAYKKLPGAKK